MAGSLHAAESRNGRAAAPSGRLCRFLSLGMLAVSAALAACSAAPPAPTPVATATDPLAAPESPAPPAEPAVARMPELPVLTGMGPDELIALLGEPDFRLREAPAELWQYRSADCVLDVFLYTDGDNYRVLRSATRNPHVAPPLIASCKAAFGRQSRQSGL